MSERTSQRCVYLESRLSVQFDKGYPRETPCAFLIK